MSENKKILYANGCSWTEGNGIENDPTLSKLNRNIAIKFKATYNWAAVLSKRLDRSLINHGIGAGSNKRIVRTTCNFLQHFPKEEYKNLLVVIGWTTVDRDEILLIEGDKEEWCKFNYSQKFSSAMTPFSDSFKRDIDNYQECYIADVYTLKSKLTYFFQEIYLMSNLLENLGIQYMFFNSLPWRWNFGEHINIDEEFKNQINAVSKPAILSTRNCNESLNIMSEFCRINNIPIDTCHHTMIDGHKLWAEHLHRELNTLYGL